MIPNLGFTTAISLFLNESDLKLDHIDYRRGTKIDGDWLLTCLTMDSSDKEKLTVTSADIDALPYVSHSYKATNWLDQIQKTKLNNKEPRIINTELDPKFRMNVNQASLRIISLPDAMIRAFIKSYIPDGEGKLKLDELIYNEIIKLKNNYKTAVLNNEDFKKYINSEQSQVDLTKFVIHLTQFKTTSKNYLVNEEEHIPFINMMKKQFPKIKNEINAHRSHSSIYQKK